MNENPNYPPNRWKNMRRMAWISLMAGLLYPFLVWISDAEKAQILQGLGYTFYLFVGAVVGAYMGFSTLGDVVDKKR